MSPFTRFVSRKVLVSAASFAVVAAGVAGVAQAGSGSATPSATVGLTSQARTLDQALADPAAALDQSAASGGSDGRQQLRADLRAARKLTGDARRQALAAIRTKAQQGAYGARVERRADRRQVHHDLFLSLLPANLRADLTALRDAPADQRRQLRASIRSKALAGGYGPEVQKAAEQLQQLRQG
jgi:hypothetical protein